MKYHETFISGFQTNTKGEAYSILQKIREAHTGWVEENAFVEELPNGKFRAVRVHYKP